VPRVDPCCEGSVEKRGETVNLVKAAAPLLPFVNNMGFE
jgi:hypothetical protein